MGARAGPKGKSGEREMVKWLQDNIYCSLELDRVYNQSSGHSSDVETPDFIIEVKRRETLDLDSWWLQAAIAARSATGARIPVVAFRQNRHKWEFLISAKLLNEDLRGYLRLKEKTFKSWALTITGDSSELTPHQNMIYMSITAENRKRMRLLNKERHRSESFIAELYGYDLKIVNKILRS